MRGVTLAAAVIAASALGPVAPASAGTCVATATPPIYKPGTSKIVASGSMRCAEPSTGMTITVCIEELYAWIDGHVWMPTWCATNTATGSTATVSGGVTIDVPIYSTVWRTAAHGSNDAGDEASGASAPSVWFNCACVIF